MNPSDAAPLSAEAAPFYSLLLLLGDSFADAPGRIHLVAKAFAVALVVCPLVYFSSVRFPAAMSAPFRAALAAAPAKAWAHGVGVMVGGALGLLGADHPECGIGITHQEVAAFQHRDHIGQGYRAGYHRPLTPGRGSGFRHRHLLAIRKAQIKLDRTFHVIPKLHSERLV